MSGVDLNPVQRRLRAEVEQNYKIVMDNIHTSRDTSEQFEKMGRAAHQLHISLNPRPTHHRYILENRLLDPDDPEFYFQVHCVQDLLAYLDDVHANDDPEDITLGHEFYFSVYTRRWSHNDQYSLIRNEDGWLVSHSSYEGQGDKYAEPILPEIMIHDSISFPRDISYLMSEIWEKAQNEGLEHEQVQELINQVADWVSNCEKNRPSFEESASL